MKSVPAAHLSLIAVLIATGVPGARTRGYHVDASRGHDSGPGSSAAPWKTVGRANRARPGSTVWVAPGTYDDAPTAPGVCFVGATAKDKGARIVTDAVKLEGRDTQISGFALAGGLDLVDGARDNLVEFCQIRDHFGVWGGQQAAPRDNRIRQTRMNVREMSAHNHGDDRDRRVPRITALSIEDCNIAVTRSRGVLWRWSGVDDAKILRTTIRLVNRGDHNDDDASWKWLYVRRALIADSRIVLDHPAGFGETGPFAPMWRDSTVAIRMVRTRVEALRGGMIFSPNTAGTWVCTCGGHRFEDVVIRAPGTVWFYQCPRKTSDTWVRSRVEAGHFEEYRTGSMPRGLSIRRFSARGR